MPIIMTSLFFHIMGPYVKKERWFTALPQNRTSHFSYMISG